MSSVRGVELDSPDAVRTYEVTCFSGLGYLRFGREEVFPGITLARISFESILNDNFSQKTLRYCLFNNSPNDVYVTSLVQILIFSRNEIKMEICLSIHSIMEAFETEEPSARRYLLIFLHKILLCILVSYLLAALIY